MQHADSGVNAINPDECINLMMMKRRKCCLRNAGSYKSDAVTTWGVKVEASILPDVGWSAQKLSR